MVHGKLWPAHPKPLPDEVLSSWIVRVAEANALKLHTLSRMLFGDQRSPWNRDIDRFAPKWLLKAICQHTGVDYWHAYRTTLAIYRTRLYPRHNMTGQLRWVLPIISHGTKRQGFGMQFCPACLAEDVVPYFRKQWRLALYTYCPTHRISLYDACPECDAPICYFRRDFGRELAQALDLGHCTSCGFDFRQAIHSMPDMPAEEVRIRFDAMLSSLANANLVGNSEDHGFFAVLHQLCRVMCMPQNAGGLQAFVNSQLGQSNDRIWLVSRSIEHLRIADRHRLLSLALWLMVDLEPRLTLAWRQRAVRYNLLVKEFSGKPKWYRDVVVKCSNWRRTELLRAWTERSNFFHL
jgi:hypothetical protein